MTDKPWKLVLLLTGIFVAGALTGGVITQRYIRNWFWQRNQPEQWGPARLKLLAERLELSPEQVEQLRPVVRRDMQDLNRLRQYGQVETHRILQRMEADISAVLTPPQKEKFEKLTQELRERGQRFSRDRPGMGGPRDRQPRGERRSPDGPPPPDGPLQPAQDQQPGKP